MTVFSVILIILVFYVIFKKKDIISTIFLILLVLGVNNVNIGYFTRIGGIVISYTDFLTAFLFFLCLITINKNRFIDKKMMYSGMILIGIVILGCIYEILIPANVEIMDYSHNWDSYFRGTMTDLYRPQISFQGFLQLFRMCLFIFIALFLKTQLSSKQWIVLGEKIVDISCFFGIIYLFELFTYRFLNSTIFYSLRLFLFDSYIKPDEGYRLMGLSTEPSYLAITIFLNLSFSLMMLYYKKYCGDPNFHTNAKFSLFIFSIIALFSSALSTVLVILVWVALLIYLFVCIDSNELLVLYGLAFIFAFVLFSINVDLVADFLVGQDAVYLHRIGNAIISIQNYIKYNSITYTSEGTRLISMIIIVKAFLERPLLGLGIGTTICFSGLISILSNIGILGFFSWYDFLFKRFSNNKVNVFFIMIYLLVFLLTGDFDLFYNTNIFLWIQLSSIISNVKNKQLGDVHNEYRFIS